MTMYRFSSDISFLSWGFSECLCILFEIWFSEGILLYFLGFFFFVSGFQNFIGFSKI
uniref:Uncharacterized protein n=1 Tax=Octopus bimaculoides TaxID=37653 RepID=A0A0L8HG93_OCTBM